MVETARINLCSTRNNLKALQEKSHLDFSSVKASEVGLQSNKSTIIWAPNGTGKSTLFSLIIDSIENKEACVFINYENYKDDVFTNSAKEIAISPNTAKLQKLKSDRDSTIGEMAFEKALKSELGIGNKTDAGKAFGADAQYHGLNNRSNIVKDFSKDAAKRIYSAMADFNDSETKFLLQNADELRAVKIEEASLRNQKESLLQSVLREVETLIDDDERQCPICGSVLKEPLIKTLRKKRAEVERLRDDLVSRYYTCCKEDAVPVASVRERLEAMGEMLKDEGSSNVMSIACVYAISKAEDLGFEEALKKIEKCVSRVNRIDKEVKELEQQRESLYALLKSRQGDLQDVYTSKFDARSIEFDDEGKSVIVKLGRKAETFSSGEQNLMALAARLAAFSASNAALLLVDDPLSSLDIANQYDIMFSLVDAARMAKDGRKTTVIVLTHNFNCINIVLSQDAGGFNAIKMLNRYISNGDKDEVALIDLEALKKTVRNSSEGSIPRATKLLSSASFIESIRDMLGGVHWVHEEQRELYEKKLLYIEACQARFSDEGDASLSCLHSLFHYSDSESGKAQYGGETLDRDDLVRGIDVFDDRTLAAGERCFPCCIIDNVYYCIALRTWLEKRIYQSLDASGKESWSRTHSFGSKIHNTFSEIPDQSEGIPGLGKVSKRFLLSLKALANQSEHINSQPYPYEYAINLSAAQLTRFILRVKGRFEVSSN